MAGRCAGHPRSVDLDELSKVLIVRDTNPTLGLPVLLRRIPERAVNPDLPAPIGEDIRAKLGHAGLLEQRNGAAG
jgi:hypothetical protein